MVSEKGKRNCRWKKLITYLKRNSDDRIMAEEIELVGYGVLPLCATREGTRETEGEGKNTYNRGSDQCQCRIQVLQKHSTTFFSVLSCYQQ